MCTLVLYIIVPKKHVFNTVIFKNTFLVVKGVNDFFFHVPQTPWPAVTFLRGFEILSKNYPLVQLLVVPLKLQVTPYTRFCTDPVEIGKHSHYISPKQPKSYTIHERIKSKKL